MMSTESFLFDISDRPLPILDHEGLQEALWAADSSTLLMVLTHLTGDDEFLQLFAPYLSSPILRPSNALAELGRELRERLFARLTRVDVAPEPPMTCELFRRMASIGAGEEIDEKSVPLLMEQMGFVKQRRHTAKIGDSIKWALRYIPYFSEWYRFRAYWFETDGLCVRCTQSRPAKLGFA